MKILLSIIPHCSTGGLPQVLVKRIELIKNDYDIFVVEYSNISDHFVIQKNRIKKLIDPDKFFTLDENKNELISIIHKIKPDIIHMEEIPEMFMDYNVAKELYNVNRKYKIFETTHSSDFDVNKKLFFPDKFIFVSQYNCFKFNKFGIPTEVVEYPVEKQPKLISRKKKDMNDLGLDPYYKHVLNIGLFTPRKNQSYAFDIARKLENEKILFHFVGNQADNFKHYWEPLLRDKPSNCILWGERDDIEKFYNACDIFLFTSMGFRFDKELNPLVIKEALIAQIPLLLFPLDVYCGKYDNEPLVTYLNGDSNIDAETIKNYNEFHFDNERQESNFKIKAVHLLLDTDDREGQSIKDMSKLSDYGIKYVQHHNKRYTDKPPKENSARPNDVNRLGAYGLNAPHYGNYLSFKRAIEEEFTDDLDFLILIEGDCIINKDIDHDYLTTKLNESLNIMNQNDIKFLSFGENYNIKTKELVSREIETIPNIDWIYITDRIIQIQFIIFSKSIRQFLLDSYKTAPWDVSDLYFNSIFSNTSYKMAIVRKSLANQLEGKSSIDGIMKRENIILLYDDDEDKIKMCLDDPYDNRENDFNVTMIDNNDMIIFNGILKLSSAFETWIQMENKEVQFVNIDFERDGVIISKIVHINNTKPDTIYIEKSDTKESDEIFIISTYTNTEIKGDITKKCIESLKKDNRKIMISSHIPLSDDIQNMVDYYIYDKFNPLIKHTLYNNYWYETGDFRAEVLFKKLSNNNNLNQSLTVLNNIENSISLAKSLGYKRVINITYDYILSENDLKTINNISNRIDDDNKEGYFMQSTDNDLDTLKTVFFIINTDLYKDIFTNPRTPYKFNNECSNMDCDNFLERYFYKKLEKHKDRLLINHTTEEQIFDGNINIFSGVEYLTYLPVENEKNTFVVWLSTNNTIDNRKIIIEHISNNVVIDTTEQDITDRSFLYKIIHIKDNEDVLIKIKIIDNIKGTILEEDEFGTINVYNFDDMLSGRGVFKVKNSLILKNKTEKMDIKMGTVINYTTNDYNTIKKSIESVKPISTLVNVSISDHKYNGIPEDMNKVNETYNELHRDNINFIQYEFDKNINADENYWKNISRFLGAKYLEEFDWILFLNSNEFIMIDNFKSFISSNLENDAYLLSSNDSPLLIKKGTISYNGNRLDMATKIKNSIINAEDKFNLKLFKKITNNDEK